MLLVTALQLSGRGADGVAVFDAYRTRLMSDLGLRPSRTAWQLYERLVGDGDAVVMA